MKKVYLITTGQSPREDIADDLRAHFSEEIEIRELGAMDEFSVDEVKSEFAPVTGESTLVSRMNDGTMLEFSEEKALPYVQKRISQACAEGADAIIILCTSNFPQMESSVPILYPGDLEHVLVKSLASGLRIAYLFPFTTHAEAMAKTWESIGLKGNYFVYHHSSGTDINEVMKFFERENADIIVLDCMGYSFEMAGMIAQTMGKPIILPRSLLVSVTESILGL